MTIQVDVYLATGVASGVVDAGEHLRDLLVGGGELRLRRAAWRGIGDAELRPVDAWSVPVDDVLVAVGDDEPPAPVHASWHQVRLEMGPYVVEGELPTQPGYDPGRALVRPSGEFVLLRDVRLGWLAAPAAASAALGPVAHVNRYGVERVDADIMLGFFFPGAVLGDAASRGAIAWPGGLPILTA